MQPNFADYSLYEVLDTLVVLSATALDTTPALKAFHAVSNDCMLHFAFIYSSQQRMAARPNIAAWLSSSKRPQQINGNGHQ